VAFRIRNQEAEMCGIKLLYGIWIEVNVDEVVEQ
jgi:hypothetical protein